MGAIQLYTKARHFFPSVLAGLALACVDGGPSPTEPSMSLHGPGLTVTSTPNKQDWKQCQNNKFSTTPCSWVTGNLDQSHNRYFEGDVVPHALRIATITDAQPITLVMTYGFKKGNKSTHDFLARWNATQTNANPCTDGSFSGGNTAKKPPTGLCTSGSLNPITARSQDLGALVLQAGALCGGNDATEQQNAIDAFDATYPAGANYPDGQKVIEGVNVQSINVTNITTACGSNGDAETTITMSVVPNPAGVSSKNLLLLIGAHVAQGAYWTTFGGAGGVNGSPYHLGLNSVDGAPAGSMDLQMSADVVLVLGATLTINKATAGGTGSFTFSGSGSGVPTSFTRNTATQGNPTAEAAFPIANTEFGTKYVQETATNGWDLTGIECVANGADLVIGRGGSASFTTGGTNAFDAGDNTVKAIISSGDSPSCTFTNTQQPIEITGSIAGLKFHDVAANGARNLPEDVGLSGWTIRLYEGTSLIASTTTDSQGGYSFGDLPLGTYTVCEVLQSGWSQSSPTTGATCSGTGEAPLGATLILTEGSSDPGPEFGNYRNATITVRKFEDLNANGTRDGADPLITWAANMHVFDGSAVHEHAQITNASNGATFSVKPGTYTICESQLASWFQSAPASGEDCSGHTGAAGNGFSVTVTSNQTSSRDFGNYRAGQLTVRKWDDTDASGTKNGGEAYIVWAADMHVFSAAPVVHEHAQITDAAAGVSFDLLPGTYTLCESQISGWVQTAPGAGVDCSGHSGAAGNGFSVTILSGQSVARQFGNRMPPITQPPLFILIDEDGIDNGPRYWENSSPFSSSTIKSFSSSDVNDDMPHLARRTQLRYFQANPGKTIWLFSGQVGDEGWFAPKTIPSSWASAGPTTDGLRNFLGIPANSFPHGVGPGLGTGNDPESLLDNIPNVIPLRAEGLYGLIGRTVCALVWDSDISINYGPIKGSLKGEKLGTVAFQVQDVVYQSGFSSSTLPRVKIQIANANDVCAEALSLYTSAPVPSSSSVPADIRPNFSGDNGGYQ